MLVDGLLFLFLALLAIFLRGFQREIQRMRKESERRNSHLMAVEETLIAVIRVLQKLNRKEGDSNVHKIPVPD